MDPAPLIVIVTPLLLVLSAASIYRSLYPYERVRWALDRVAEYRVLKRRARSKRDLKRLRALESEYREAKRIVARSLLVKLVLLLSGYVVGSILVLTVVPAVPSPYHLPPLTITVDGAPYMLSVTAYFVVYVILFFVLRDSFL